MSTGDLQAPTPSGEEDLRLIRRVGEGQEEALQQLHRRYAPLLFHLACRALDPASAEEVVQDTFLALWRRATDFDPARGSLKTWLLSIGRHRLLDELRSRSRRPQEAGDLLLDEAPWTEEPLPDEALWQEYRRGAISQALAALPEPQRAALRLAFFAELTHEEVARALNVPLGTAKTRIRSGLRLLERHLGGLVATLAVAVLGLGGWFLRQQQGEAAQSQRAVHLLADSQTRALRLSPRTPGTPPEAGTHAVYRSAPGAGLAVLTLSHFPAPPTGTRHVLWIRTGSGWRPVDLPKPDAEGRTLKVLEAPWLAEAWPQELRITRESRFGDRPSGPEIVAWEAPPQPAP